MSAHRAPPARCRGRTPEPHCAPQAAPAQPVSRLDGRRILLLANVGDPKSAQAGADAGAEGVGLFRTEFLFLDSAKEPTVAEQEEAYVGVFAAFPDGKKVVVRTLDAGADKPLAFLNQGDEPNPALGVRGVRVAFEVSASWTASWRRSPAPRSAARPTSG